MAKTIELDQAHACIALCLREVEAGEEYVITRDGKPVARLVPVRGFGPLDRDSLHQRGWPQGVK
jgi:prevent-host-death family protein